ncbi:MAG: hypothetical protein BMS9Abin02_1387 [Anaerolineae bacterium]|nr:MAG: hypothetical protein BMS9Abin02_1387 [Anaerolineae bacterium]
MIEPNHDMIFSAFMEYNSNAGLSNYLDYLFSFQDNQPITLIITIV